MDGRGGTGRRLGDFPLGLGGLRELSRGAMTYTCLMSDWMRKWMGKCSVLGWACFGVWSLVYVW